MASSIAKALSLQGLKTAFLNSKGTLQNSILDFDDLDAVVIDDLNPGQFKSSFDDLALRLIQTVHDRGGKIVFTSNSDLNKPFVLDASNQGLMDRFRSDLVFLDLTSESVTSFRKPWYEGLEISPASSAPIPRPLQAISADLEKWHDSNGVNLLQWLTYISNLEGPPTAGVFVHLEDVDGYADLMTEPWERAMAEVFEGQGRAPVREGKGTTRERLASSQASIMGPLLLSYNNFSDGVLRTFERGGRTVAFSGISLQARIERHDPNEIPRLEERCKVVLKELKFRRQWEQPVNQLP